MENIASVLGIDADILQGLIVGIVILLGFAVIAGLTSWLERRVAARMQSRIGPNRVGTQGLLQFVADAVKLILKEDLIPDGADRVLFKLAPYLVFMGVFSTLVVLPWGTRELIVADLNVGVLYFMAITSLVVIGVLMAGWGSNNKWSLLGGMRAVAQIVSYEIPLAMGLLVPVLIVGSLSMGDLMAAQGWAPWQWTVFSSPFAALAFIFFFTGSLAESNRIPFDMPEAESELVSGFNTEYSGFRFAVFFLAEFGNLFIVGLASTTIFLGGGNLPEFFGNSTALSVIVMMLKTLFIMFVIIWLRWTLPRFRIDQLMALSWKYLLPGSLLAFFGQAAYMLIAREFPMLNQVVPVLVFAVFVLVLGKFIQRVVVNVKEQSTPISQKV